MGVSALEHVTIRCAQLQRTRDFYVELMGLAMGRGPISRSGGTGSIWEGFRWCTWSKRRIPPGPGAEKLSFPMPLKGTGSFDHVAFRGDDFNGMRKSCNRRA